MDIVTIFFLLLMIVPIPLLAITLYFFIVGNFHLALLILMVAIAFIVINLILAFFGIIPQVIFTITIKETM